MSDLTIKAMRIKIEQVEKDIDQLRLTGESSRKLEVLCEYKKYLEEELEMIKREERSAK